MEGSPEFEILEDKWTAISVDNKRCLIWVFYLPQAPELVTGSQKPPEFAGHGGGHVCPLITAACALQVSAV